MTPTEERLNSLEAENVTLREAIASLESGIAQHKPMRLGEIQHSALRAVVQAARRAESQEPFVRPTNHFYDLRPRELRPHTAPEHREEATA